MDDDKIMSDDERAALQIKLLQAMRDLELEAQRITGQNHSHFTLQCKLAAEEKGMPLVNLIQTAYHHKVVLN